MSALKRIRKELDDLDKNGIENAFIYPINDFKWDAFIIGPKDSLYEGGIYHFTISFPNDYPFKPPRCDFMTKIYHPMFGGNHLYLESLKNDWSPEFTISKIISDMISLLSYPYFDDFMLDPFNVDVCKVYKENKINFYNIAREWAIKYAGAPKNKFVFFNLDGKDRINSELKYINNDKNYKLISFEDSYKIKSNIKPPKFSPYKEEQLEIIFEIQKEYPFKAPTFYFTKSDKFLKNAEKACNLILREKWNHKLLITDASNIIFDYLYYNFINITINKKDELENDLNNIKNKNKNLMETNENLISSVIDLNEKIKDKLEILKNRNDQAEKNSETMKTKFEKIILEKNKEIIELKNKLLANNFKLNNGEKLISVIISTIDEKINYSFICKNTDKFKNIENQFYNEFPEYKDKKKEFMRNGKIIDSDKSLDENNIKMNSNIILLITNENN